MGTVNFAKYITHLDSMITTNHVNVRLPQGSENSLSTASCWLKAAGLIASSLAQCSRELPVESVLTCAVDQIVHILFLKSCHQFLLQFGNENVLSYLWATFS